jgi:dTDP-4-dehydrorhamnose 3,5-epimerase
MDQMTGNKPKIDGVVITTLRQIDDERGAVLHILRCDSPIFTHIGEVYCSLVYAGKIKAWKRHNFMTQHFAVPMGKINLVLYDDRPLSSSHGQIEDYIIGRPDHYFLIRIPPLIWYGFQGLGIAPALIVNCANLRHDPGEVRNLPVDTNYIPYNWLRE